MSDTVSFVETNAQEIYNEIIAALESHVNEPLYPGDERRIYGEAMAAVVVAIYNLVNETAKQTLLRYARGVVLDAIGEMNGTPRLTGTKATATQRFTLSGVMSSNVVIPAGTRVTADSVRYFATEQAAVIQAGTLSIEAAVDAETVGAGYNGYAADTMTTLVDLIPYVAAATNTTQSAGGSDGEPYTEDGDNHYRERIRLGRARLTTAGPASSYEYWALTADSRLASVKATSPAAGEVLITALMAGGEMPSQAVLDAILAVVNQEDLRPMNDLVSAAAPQAVPYDVELKYYTTAEREAEVVESVEGAGGAIEQYIAWQNAALGRGINPDELRRFVLPYADRLEITAPVFTEVGAAAVAQWSGSLTVSHELSGG